MMAMMMTDDGLIFQMADREEDQAVRRPEVGRGNPGLT